MEVVAVAEREHRWRWEIRHNGTIVKESTARFPTIAEAITDGKRSLLGLWTGADRPPISRRSQRPEGRSSGGPQVA